jgi:hypothetical protein
LQPLLSFSLSLERLLVDGLLYCGCGREPEPASTDPMTSIQPWRGIERAVHAVSEQASAASSIVAEILNVGLDGGRPVTLHTKMLRLELLRVKADLERDLSEFVLTGPTAA